MTTQASFITSAGLQMPCLIYGTAWKEEKTADLVQQAVLAGFRAIDTACQPKHYNEAGVGDAIKHLQQHGLSREQLFLQTKFTPFSGHDPKRIPYDKNAELADQVRQSFARSQHNLQSDQVDCYILHSPIDPHEDLMQIWRAMEELYKSGKTRQLGISNCYDLQQLQTLFHEAEIKPAVIQNRFYQATGYDQELRDWCMQKNIHYQSFWTLTANKPLLNSDAISKPAKAYNKTLAQILFRYLHQQRVTPLIGAINLKHLHEDLEIFTFELTDAELAAIQSLLQDNS